MADIVKKSKEKALDLMRLKMDEYNEKYSKARSRLKDLDHQLTFLKHEISLNRSKLKFKSSISAKVYFGCDAVKDNLRNTMVLLTNLEKRQHGMLRRKSEWEVLNRERRCNIDKVRHKITRAKQREHKLSRELANFQTTFAELLTSCSVLSNERDHVESQIQSLFNSEEIEIEAYDEEMKKLGDYIREQAEIVEQLKHVGTKVFEQKHEDHLTKEEEERLRHKMHHHDDDHHKAARVSKMSIRAAFDKVMDESGLSSVNDLVKLFVMRSDEIFDLYGFVQRVRHDLQNAQTVLDQSQSRLRKYIESEGEQHKKHLNMLKTVQSQKRALLSGLEKSKNSLETNRGRIRAWCDISQDIVSRYLGHEALLKSEPCLKRFVDAATEYKSRTGISWKVIEHHADDSDDENDVTSGIMKRSKSRKKRLKRRAAKMRRKSHAPMFRSKMSQKPEEEEISGPPLVTPRNLKNVLGTVEEMSMSIVKRLVRAAKTGTTFLKMGLASSTFKPPRCKTRHGIGSVPEKLPSSTMNEKELNEDDRDVKMIDLSEFRESIRSKIFGSANNSGGRMNSSSSSSGEETKRRTASGRILSSVPTSSRSVLSNAASKRGTSSRSSHHSSARTSRK